MEALTSGVFPLILLSHHQYKIVVVLMDSVINGSRFERGISSPAPQAMAISLLR